MASKDNWDKFDLIFKALVLGIIPIVIKFGADNIAQSVERGKIVQSQIENLTTKDIIARRDIALISLDAAIPIPQKCSLLWIGCKPDPEKDQVIEVALIVIKDLAEGAQQQNELKSSATATSQAIQSTAPISRQPISLESSTAAKIIIKRSGDKEYAPLKEITSNQSRNAISNANNKKKASVSEAQTQTQTSKIIFNIQPSPNTTSTDQSLNGVKIVYIQYKNNIDKAKNLQEKLVEKGVLVPEIQQIKEIKSNDIRYSKASEEEIAKKLQRFAEETLAVKFTEPFDLSKNNYKVPSGQFEVWLND